MHMALIPQGSLVCQQDCLPPAPTDIYQFRKYEYRPIIPRDPPQLQRNANIEHSSTRRASGNRGGKLDDVSPTCHCLH